MFHCDLESNGFVFETSRVWVLVSYDDEKDQFRLSFDTREFDIKKPDEWFIGTNYICYRGHTSHLRLLEKGSVNFHNYFGFDRLVIQKFLPDWNPKDEQDSYVLSMLFNPDRGFHGLDEWGKRLGIKKPKYNDWAGGLTKGMAIRCIEDAKITHKTFNALRKEAEKHDWSKAVWLEYNIARIMGEQAAQGVSFDIDKAYELAEWLWTKVHELGNDIQKDMPYVVVKGTEYKRQPLCSVKFEPPNINSFQQVKNYLLSVGWKPTEFTEKGSPKITEDSFHTIKGELGQKIALRSVLKHRAQMLFNITDEGELKGLINLTRSDGRLEAGAITNGTNTGRMKHRVVVNIPKAKDVKKYGFPYDIRELFINDR